MWLNTLNGFHYNGIGLRYDPTLNIFIDLFSIESIIFIPIVKNIIIMNPLYLTNTGSIIFLMAFKKLIFFGNQYYWCYQKNNYSFSGFWCPLYII